MKGKTSTGPHDRRLRGAIALALLALSPAAALAQHADHEQDPHQAHAQAQQAPEHVHAVPPQEHQQHHPQQEQQPHDGHRQDSADQGHEVEHDPTSSDEAPVDHAAMAHGPGAGDDDRDAGMDHSTMDHSMMDHAMHGPALPADAPPREPIPAITTADRAAAFPDVHGHAVHDKAVHAFWLVDRIEAWDGDEGTALGWEGLAWIGTDLDRVWLRTEGEQEGGETASANVEVFYGRAIARWWDLLAGVRHDFGEGPSQTWAAIGVTGLAPYKFEVDATAYFGSGGRTAAVLEAEYDTLLTNRLILQWVAEAEFHGKDDPRRGVGAGLGTVEAGLRLRYEFTRRFAPYIGVVRERAFGDTADLRRGDGDDIDDTRFVIGVRTWF